MNEPNNTSLTALGLLAQEYYLAMQEVKKAEARIDKAHDTLRRLTRQNHQQLSKHPLYKHRQEIAQLNQLYIEVKAAQLRENSCRAKFIKAAKEIL